MILAVDFDGTCVTHEYPKLGRDIGAASVLKTVVDNGHKIILYTMRSGDTLKEAVHWFKTNGIELYGINENPTQKQWTSSPKIYAHLYIDDANLGCPKLAGNASYRPYVDWKYVVLELEKLGFLLPDDVSRVMKDVIGEQNDLNLFQ